MDRNRKNGSRLPRGHFIVIEGIDGSGSTTQGDELTSYLQKKSQKVFFTNEPSNGPAGMLIRLALAKRLLGPNYDYHDPNERQSDSGTALDAHTLALLFAADRTDHIHTQIRPNLDRGRHVICDRYLLSTLAYQGQTLDINWLIQINAGALRPDLTFYLDVPADKARMRMRQTRWAKDLYEDESQQRLIRQTYAELIEREIPLVGPVVYIDASRPRTEVTKHMIQVLDTFMQTGRVEEARGELTLF